MSETVPENIFQEPHGSYEEELSEKISKTYMLAKKAQKNDPKSPEISKNLREVLRLLLESNERPLSGFTKAGKEWLSEILSAQKIRWKDLYDSFLKKCEEFHPYKEEYESFPVYEISQFAKDENLDELDLFGIGFIQFTTTTKNYFKKTPKHVHNKCSFNGCNFENVEIRNSTLVSCNVRNCVLENCEIFNGSIANTEMENCSGNHVYMFKNTIKKCAFIECNAFETMTNIFRYPKTKMLQKDFLSLSPLDSFSEKSEDEPLGSRMSKERGSFWNIFINPIKMFQKDSPSSAPLDSSFEKSEYEPFDIRKSREEKWFQEIHFVIS